MPNDLMEQKQQQENLYIVTKTDYAEVEGNRKDIDMVGNESKLSKLIKKNKLSAVCQQHASLSTAKARHDQILFLRPARDCKAASAHAANGNLEQYLTDSRTYPGVYLSQGQPGFGTVFIHAAHQTAQCVLRCLHGKKELKVCFFHLHAGNSCLIHCRLQGSVQDVINRKMPAFPLLVDAGGRKNGAEIPCACFFHTFCRFYLFVNGTYLHIPCHVSWFHISVHL